MHPLFAPLDAHGEPAALSGRPASSARTCGACHDADGINARNDHWSNRVKVECVACHFEGGRFPEEAMAYDREGRLRREAMRISPPRDEHCAACHGLVQPGKEPVRIPDDYARAAIESGGLYLHPRHDLTVETGAIISPQNLSESLLNLSGKSSRHYPWDAHARRLVGCVSCHYSSNNPTIVDAKRSRPGFLREDPRRLTLSEYLRRPDHRLAAADCQVCHAPLEVHDFLPYKQRHLAALACEACHVPQLFGPAARMIDSTVVTASGGPAISWRGIEPRPRETLNTAYALGYRPILARPAGADPDPRLAAYNAIEVWSWRSDGGSGTPVPWNAVRAVYLEGSGYAPEVLRIFDRDGDGALTTEELRLDSPAKTSLMRDRLVAAGVPAPEIARSLEAHPIRHGVLSREQVSRDCRTCHAGEESRFTAGLELSPYLPGDGSTSRPPEVRSIAAQVVTSGTTTRIDPLAPRGFHIFGHSRGGWSDRLGFAVFLAVALGAAAHAAFRAVLRKARAPRVHPTERVYLFTAYERIWHWLMAASVLALMISGLQVHFAGPGAWMPLPAAVAVHNFFAVVLTVNGFLSLFYHITTRAIRQFLPPRSGLLGGILEHLRFYTSGIFLGRPHPSPKTPERKLNPLQQLTYLSLLNILFPLQVVTGALIWGVSRRPDIASAIGGLTVVAPLHNLGAWLFLSFFALHLYLTTTGHTVFSNLRAMLSGYDEVEAVPVGAGGPRSGGPHA